MREPGQPTAGHEEYCNYLELLHGHGGNLTVLTWRVRLLASALNNALIELREARRQQRRRTFMRVARKFVP